MFDDILGSKNQNHYWWFDLDYNIKNNKMEIAVFEKAIQKAVNEKIFIVDQDPGDSGILEPKNIIGEISDYRIYRAADKCSIQVKIYHGKLYLPNAKVGFRGDADIQLGIISQIIFWCFYFKNS